MFIRYATVVYRVCYSGKHGMLWLYTWYTTVVYGLIYPVIHVIHQLYVIRYTYNGCIRPVIPSYTSVIRVIHQLYVIHTTVVYALLYAVIR